MSNLVHNDYYRDKLEKRYCHDCHKTFIIGEELRKAVSCIACPYCQKVNTEAFVWSDEELGCVGIYFFKTENNYYNRCCICNNKLNTENMKIPDLCVDCENLFKNNEVIK